MGKILGFATIEGASAATTFVSADAKIWHHDEELSGQVFLARKGREVAAAFQLPNWTARGDLTPLARRGSLGCSTECVEQNGLTIVTGTWLHRGRSGSAIWDDRQ